jgi:hypothetical protein
MDLPFGELPDRITVREWYEKLTQDRLRPVLPADLPRAIKDILDRAMDSEPHLRPSVQDILGVVDEYLVWTSTQGKQELQQLMLTEQYSGSAGLLSDLQVDGLDH